MPPAGTEGASATCFAQEPSVLIGVWVCPTCPCGRVAHANEWVQGGERPRLPAAAPVPDTPRPCGLRVVPTSQSSISSLSSPPPAPALLERWGCIALALRVPWDWEGVCDRELPLWGERRGGLCRCPAEKLFPFPPACFYGHCCVVESQ